MRISPLVVFLSFSLLVTQSFAKDKNREWQTGKLVSLEQGSSETVGYVTGNSASVVGAYSECKNWLYTVDTDSLTYVFSAHTGAWCANHPRPFTVGVQIKFLLESNGKAVLLDEEGKEFKASLLKKVIKQPAH